MGEATATRYHDFSAGHRVAGHESKCAHLHGHNYRVHFTVAGDLDSVGRVMDFSVIKSGLCQWLEDNWDHKFLLWTEDLFARCIVPAFQSYSAQCYTRLDHYEAGLLADSLVLVPFNPTAENMAQYLVDVVGPDVLAGTGTRLVRCVVEETRKCSAAYDLQQEKN